MNLPEWRVVAVMTVALLTGCSSDAPPPPPPPPVAAVPLVFDTAMVWVHGASDSTRLVVEVAGDDAHRNQGLMNRTTLDSESGMIFEWPLPQKGDTGFWMFQTLIPLDIAFLDVDGTVVKILSMVPCPAKFNPGACPTYSPGVEYLRAIEANQGWFTAHGIAEGARVSVVR